MHPKSASKTRRPLVVICGVKPLVCPWEWNRWVRKDLKRAGTGADLGTGPRKTGLLGCLRGGGLQVNARSGAWSRSRGQPKAMRAEGTVPWRMAAGRQGLQWEEGSPGHSHRVAQMWGVVSLRPLGHQAGHTGDPLRSQEIVMLTPLQTRVPGLLRGLPSSSSLGGPPSAWRIPCGSHHSVGQGGPLEV